MYILPKQNNNTPEAANNNDVTSAELLDNLSKLLQNGKTEASQAIILSQELADQAAAAGNSLKETFYGYEQIQESNHNVFTQIEELGRLASNISTITMAIDNLANRTHLLALNAAIIAAQAGEQGHSFSVVSDEISALSKRTKDSIREISVVLTAIQETTAETVFAMEEAQKNMATASGMGQEALLAFASLKEIADKNTEHTQKLLIDAYQESQQVELLKHLLKNGGELNVA